MVYAAHDHPHYTQVIWHCRVSFRASTESSFIVLVYVRITIHTIPQVTWHDPPQGYEYLTQSKDLVYVLILSLHEDLCRDILGLVISKF